MTSPGRDVGQGKCCLVVQRSADGEQARAISNAQVPPRAREPSNRFRSKESGLEVLRRAVHVQRRKHVAPAEILTG